MFGTMTVTPVMTKAFQSLLSLRAHIATTLFTSQVYYHFIETLFFLLIIYLVFTRAYKPWSRQPSPTLSAHDEAARIASWKPEPLAPPLDPDVVERHPMDVEIASVGAGLTVTLTNQKTVVNMSTNNFLGLLKHPDIEHAALSTMREYGCGACGPRGFYGTTDIHLECEDTIAKFSDSNTAILYSFGAATGNSTIPAFVKRGDLVVIDDALNYTLRLGVELSRAQVLTFAHNDMCDLRSVLMRAVANDVNDPARPYSQRRIIIVEGISQQAGDVSPLDEIVKLKDEFRFRVLLDESLSIGVLGRSGRGALEEFGLPRRSVEIATADLGNAVASVGGFCVGTSDVVDHQRLSGAGYCFSASQPAFLAKAATTALNIIQRDGHDLVATLRERIAAFYDEIDEPALIDYGWRIDGHKRSPILHLRRACAGDIPEVKFTEIQELCVDDGLLIARPAHIKGTALPCTHSERGSDVKGSSPVSSLCVTLSAGHTDQQVRQAAKTISKVLRDINRSS